MVKCPVPDATETRKHLDRHWRTHKTNECKSDKLKAMTAVTSTQNHLISCLTTSTVLPKGFLMCVAGRSLLLMFRFVPSEGAQEARYSSGGRTKRTLSLG